MKYLVEVPVKSVDGSQSFMIEADSAEKAIAAVRNGGGEFVEDNLEVTELDFDSAVIAEELG